MSHSKWNKLIKSSNGNRSDTIRIGHWNSGSAHLCKTSTGKSKLEHIKHILSKNNLDILGISEANLPINIPEYVYQIDGYKVQKSGGQYARVITYSKLSLDCKLISNITDGNTACVWLEAGKTRSKWLVGNYYREHTLLGEPTTRQWNKQVERFENFLNSIETIRLKLHLFQRDNVQTFISCFLT